MEEEKLDSQLFVRCSAHDRERVKQVSQKLSVSAASVARVALKKGLDIVAERGITFDDPRAE